MGKYYCLYTVYTEEDFIKDKKEHGVEMGVIGMLRQLVAVDENKDKIIEKVLNDNLENFAIVQEDGFLAKYNGIPIYKKE